MDNASPAYNLTTQHGPDQADPRTINWPERQERALFRFAVVDGVPQNPFQVGLPAGRGDLWHWGEAVAADAVVLATVDDVVHLLMVERADGHGWALPGGMLDPREAPRDAVARELEEETGLLRAAGEFTILEPRGVPDPRAGANAWVVTFPGILRLDVESLPPVQGSDDACAAAWIRANSYDELATQVEVFPAHTDLVRDVLRFNRR